MVAETAFPPSHQLSASTRKAVHLAKKLLMESSKKQEINRPVWSKTLRDVRELDGKWIVGTTDTSETASAVIDAYCRFLPCDFVRSHPSTLERRHERRAEKSRILWQLKDIPFNGVPFSVTSTDVLKCTFSMNYTTSKKKRKSLIESNPSHSKENEPSIENKNSPSLPHPPLKTYDCPAKITVKTIKRYLDYTLDFSATKSTKLAALKSLKQEIEKDYEMNVEVIIWVSLPLPSIHNHCFSGKDRIIHPHIREKIKEFLNHEVVSADILKQMLDKHVKDIFQGRELPPSLSDQAYYPSLHSIKNVVYNHMNRKKIAYKESKVIRKRKNINVGPSKCKQLMIPLENQTTDCLGALIKPNSLQDVVQAFCSDSLEEISDYRSCKSAENEMSTLGKSVREKLHRLISLSYSINDMNKFKELSNNLSAILETFKGIVQTETSDLTNNCYLDSRIQNGIVQAGRPFQNYVDAHTTDLLPDYASVTQENELLPVKIYTAHPYYTNSEISEFRTEFTYL